MGNFSKLFLTLLLIFVFTQSAYAQQDNQDHFVSKLTEQNIITFLKEISKISTTRNIEMLDSEIATFLDNHLSNRSVFTTKMRFQLPGFPTNESNLTLQKQDYIDSIIEGRVVIDGYQSSIEIKDLKIAMNGKSASFKSNIIETGTMSFPKDPDNSDDMDIIPIEGVSSCNQKLIVSFNNYIQIAKADCSTLISFDPFGGKPLLPE